ncbi:glycoprotein Xg isoform X2 [Sarcophilus harrisii]|uniref:glycoprotein Xg isoform X2 n=1 Tax=Sarcophilus harrisii TaxID=9305 RepID=UPI001301D92F|nr:glycoprotein Xg isoform X2 [Sarcophilus harrisii]
MARWQKVSFLMLLCFLIHIQGQDDFDLADALDDTEEITRKPNPITRKPGSGIYPKPNPPNRPQPGIYDNPGGNINDLDLDDGRYPPKPRPPAGGGGYHSNNFGNTHGGGGYNPSSHYGNNYGGGGYSNYGNTQGDSVARIVSPIVSVVVVSLIGAATSYFAYNRRRNCCRTNDFNRGKWEIRRLCSGSKKQCHK